MVQNLPSTGWCKGANGSSGKVKQQSWWQDWFMDRGS
jgi:hypothetical protein